MPEWNVKLKRGKKQWEAGVNGPQTTENEVRVHLLATIDEVEILSVERSDLPKAQPKETKK